MNEMPECYEDCLSVCNKNTNSNIYLFIYNISIICLYAFGDMLSHIHAYVKFLCACIENMNLATDYQKLRT